MLRFQLKRKFNNNKSEETSNFYVKQRWNIFKIWTLVRSMITKCFGKP